MSAQPAPTVGNLIDLGDDTFVPNPQLAPQVTAQMANLGKKKNLLIQKKGFVLGFVGLMLHIDN